MRKLLISFSILISLGGCSSIDTDRDTWDVLGNLIPRSMEKLPFVYRPLVVQGNIITQESVNKLKLGMDKKQVEYAVGTPLLRDVFHADRWDYYYGIGIGDIELEKHFTLEFENNQLVKISGDYIPQPPAEDEGMIETADPVIIVPDWEAPKKTLYQQMMSTVGFGSDEDAVVKEAADKP